MDFRNEIQYWQEERGLVQMEKFSDFISEQKNEEPYRIICFYHADDLLQDTPVNNHLEMMSVMNNASKKSGVEIHYADYVGSYLSEKNGKTILHSLSIDKKTGHYIKPDLKTKETNYIAIELNQENDIILYRDLPSRNVKRRWLDLIKELEFKNFTTINSLECYDICASKYLTDVYLKEQKLLTPKTSYITNISDAQRAFESLNTKFPVVLKASAGSQTGIGVVILESMRSLDASVQMCAYLDVPMVIQEYVKTDFDVRVIVLDGVVLGAMKRKVITDDFRSNVSLGADSEMIELIDIEMEDSIIAANAVKGRLVGVDFIPAKNRKKERPYILEVNATPGFSGIEQIHKGTVSTILDYFKNRDNWRK